MRGCCRWRRQYFNNDYVAAGATIGGVFLGTLMIVSIITVRISDMILDSRIGALDRTLGFLFGLARGLIIVVVAFVFFDWLVPTAAQPEWVRNAKSRVVLQGTGNWLMSMLPDDPESTILKRLKRPKGEDQEAPDAPSDQRSDTGSPGREQAEKAGYDRTDRLGMRQLIDTKAAAQMIRRTTTARRKTMQPLDDHGPDDLDLDLNADRLREECGVFGIFGHPDAAAITALGLHALQHRGQEAAGIVSFDGKRFHSERRLGLVGDTFSTPRGDRPPARQRRHRPCALFDHRRNHPAQRAAAVRRTRTPAASRSATTAISPTA